MFEPLALLATRARLKSKHATKHSSRTCSVDAAQRLALSQANYEVEIHSLSRPFFRVTAKCKHGFGTAKVKECHKDGDPFELEGCMDACASTKKAAEAGYVV